MFDFCTFFQNICYYFSIIAWIKKRNNFQIAKVQSHRLAQLLLDFCQFQPSVAYTSVAYKTKKRDGGHPKCIQLRTGRGGVTPFEYVRTYTISFHVFGSIFCLIVSCFILRNSTLPFFKKDVFVRNGYFSLMKSISVVIK